MISKKRSNPDRYKQETEIALFCYGLVVQLIHTLPDPGQPELCRIPRLAVHEAFYQRLTTTYHSSSLDLPQTSAYIHHHVQSADYLSGSLFTDDATTCIYDHTKCIPRRINRVCTHAMIAGAIENKKTSLKPVSSARSSQTLNGSCLVVYVDPVVNPQHRRGVSSNSQHSTI